MRRMKEVKLISISNDPQSVGGPIPLLTVSKIENPMCVDVIVQVFGWCVKR